MVNIKTNRNETFVEVKCKIYELPNEYAQRFYDYKETLAVVMVKDHLDSYSCYTLHGNIGFFTLPKDVVEALHENTNEPKS